MHVRRGTILAIFDKTQGAKKLNNLTKLKEILPKLKQNFPKSPQNVQFFFESVKFLLKKLKNGSKFRSKLKEILRKLNFPATKVDGVSQKIGKKKPALVLTVLIIKVINRSEKSQNPPRI